MKNKKIKYFSLLKRAMFTKEDFCDYKNTVTIKYPSFIKYILVCAEDRNFYKHKGFDLQAMYESFKKDIKFRKILYGGSTITQQLAKNLFLTNAISLRRKIKELLIAICIEKNYTKEQILDLYLNNIFFINNQKGLQNAAKFYYKEDIDDLSFFQAVCLISLLPAPHKYSPHVNIKISTMAIKNTLNILRFNGVFSDEDLKELQSKDFWYKDKKSDNYYKKKMISFYEK